MITKWQKSTLYLDSKWKQKKLWEDIIGVDKLLKGSNNKSEDKDIKENNFVSKNFWWKVQLINNCNLVNWVNLIHL